jgi:hypothetical protein
MSNLLVPLSEDLKCLRYLQFQSVRFFGFGSSGEDSGAPIAVVNTVEGAPYWVNDSPGFKMLIELLSTATHTRFRELFQPCMDGLAMKAVLTGSSDLFS